MRFSNGFYFTRFALCRCFLSVLLIGSLLMGTARATIITPISLPSLNTNIAGWTEGWRYNSIFPGERTWNGVTFNLENRNGYKAYIGTMEIPVNIFGATSAYTLINSAYGRYGYNIGSVEFFGTNNAYHKVMLKEGSNVRDHYSGSYNNTIDGVNAVSAFSSGRARLDMQIYQLPDSFLYQTLETIKFTSFNYGSPYGTPFIAAATVGSVSEPGLHFLFGLGLIGMVWSRAKKESSNGFKLQK